MAQKVDPNNVELKKGFVFNETGNIMMSTTDFSNPVIEQSVRNVFQEVAVFFAGMTKALESTAVSGSSALIDTESGMNYSLYDYAAMKKIIDSSGCFIQVNEEDVDFHSDSFGMDFSKELVEAKKVWNFKVKLVKNNILLDKSGGVTLLISEVKKK